MENVGEGDESILLEALLEASAEYYSLDLKKKIKRGQRESIAKGKYCGGPIPYGYKLSDGKLLVDEKNAPAIRYLFEQYASGVPMKEIIDELTRRGVRCAVLEAGRILSGQTGNTTAKITSQHGLIYDKLIDTLGFEHARAYAAANEKAISDYGRIASERKIDCEFKTLPSYVYSAKNAEYLKKEAESAASLGIASSFVTDVMLPFPTAGAVRFENQAQFHPLKFLTSLLPGLEIYENTEVLSAKGNKIKTNRSVVTAEKLVFATNFPPINFPGLYFAKMHRERSYVVALDGAPMLGGIYYGADEDGLSLRNAGSGLLLRGGAGHRTGENRRGGRYAALHTAAERFFPGSRVVCEWSAQDCMPADSVPYIGRYSKSEPDWYVATGFQKWGMTSAMVSAMLLSDLICGKKNPYEAVFSPERKRVGAAACIRRRKIGEKHRGTYLLSAREGFSRDCARPCRNRMGRRTQTRRISGNSAGRENEAPCRLGQMPASRL